MQPLYLDVVPVEHTAGVVAALVAAIHNQTDHINCGIIGSRFLLDVLTKHGHGDLALTLATTKTCPGWGYMVEQQEGDPHDTPGTLWETWQDGEKTPFCVPFCTTNDQ
jgi:alpha-L-rhamnosidase